MTLVLPPDRRPNLLGIGAAKSGTTWLAGVLAHHPDIFVHPQKELNALVYNDLDERLDEYAAYFDEGRAAKVRCDFSVRYLSAERAPAAAGRLAPDARLLLVLRNPVDQVQSHYWHLRRQNFHQDSMVVDTPDLFEALERFPHLLKEPALYGKHLARWLEIFPRERLLILDSQDLRDDPDTMLGRICAFLEVGEFDFSGAIRATSAQEGRGGVSPRGGKSERLFSRLYVAVARGPYQWLKSTLGVRGAEQLKRTLRLRETAEAVFFKSGYPKLNPADRARLFEVFRQDIEQLSAITPLAKRWSANT
ncbi:MAG: sulfotransferase domain-containing protein [Alphaproteobacteria bacterium]